MFSKYFPCQLGPKQPHASKESYVKAFVQSLVVSAREEEALLELRVARHPRRSLQAAPRHGITAAWYCCMKHISHFLLNLTLHLNLNFTLHHALTSTVIKNVDAFEENFILTSVPVCYPVRRRQVKHFTFFFKRD